MTLNLAQILIILTFAALSVMAFQISLLSTYADLPTSINKNLLIIPYLATHSRDISYIDNGSDGTGPKNYRASSLQSNSESVSQLFNPKIPLTLPLMEGYHNGTKVFFIYTEVSDEKMAQNMTRMTNFQLFHVPRLGNLSGENLSNIYAFTNGMPASGSFTGGPFEFQMNVFDSVPTDERYSSFGVLHFVTWKDPTAARLLDSVSSIIDAQAKGELRITNSDIVINSPILSWIDHAGVIHTLYTIEKPLLSMPGFKAQVMDADIYNYVARLKLTG
jgi:hypothetical protein